MKTREPVRQVAANARRKEIVDAAAVAFHDHGYDATTMQDIADRVGMLKGSLYHHISSKEDLLAAVLQETQAGGYDIVQRHAAATGSCRERMRGFVEEYTAYCIDNRIRSAIFEREFRCLSPALRRELIATRDQFDSFLRTLLRDGMGAREFARDLDEVVTANTIYGMMNTVYRWYSPSGKRSKTVIAAHIAELVDRMLVEPPSRD